MTTAAAADRNSRPAIAAVCAALLAAAAAAQPLPVELMHLQTLIGKERELVDAARRFQIQQEALIEWDREIAADYSEAGQQHLLETKAQDVERRIDLIERAWRFVLGHYPNNALANTYLGELLYDLRGQKSEAVTLWLRAVAADNKLSEAHNNLGMHFFTFGDYDRGLRHLGRALELEPKNPNYLYNLAQMYLVYFHEIAKRYNTDKKKIYREAMKMSRDAAKFAPNDYEIVMDYAVNFFAAENFGIEVDWNEAAAAWQAARNVAADDSQRFYTYLNEGRVWMRAGDNAMAAQCFERAAQIRPDSDAAQNLLEEARGNAPAQ